MEQSKKSLSAIRPPKLSGRRRAVELVKDLLIVLLACSAVYLAARSQLHTGLVPWFERILGTQDTQQSSPMELSQMTDLVQPARAAVCLGVGKNGEISRYGAQYNDALTQRLSSAMSGLVGEGLASAQTPSPISRTQWEEALCAPGIYLDYQGAVPLSSLCQWLNEGADNTVLTASARHIVLADLGDDTAVLCYKDAVQGMYYACKTTVSCQGYFSSSLEPYTDNGARFAFELDQEDYADVGGDMMILGTSTQPAVYQVSTPLDLNEDRSRDDLQQALLFRTQDYQVPGMWVAREEDTLRMSTDGRVTYEAGSGSRYSVERDGDGSMDVTDLLEVTHRLATDALNVWCGGASTARLTLSSVTQLEDGSWQVRYHYSLNGIALLFSDGGDAAVFEANDGRITGFTLRLRCYEDTGEHTPILREQQAAAALDALSQGEELELMLSYEDTGGDKVQAAWIAR